MTNVIVFELSGSISTDWKEWDELGKHAGCLVTASGAEGGREGEKVSPTKTAPRGGLSLCVDGGESCRDRFLFWGQEQEAVREVTSVCLCNFPAAVRDLPFST